MQWIEASAAYEWEQYALAVQNARGKPVVPWF